VAAGCGVVLLLESALALALAGGIGWSDGSSEPGPIVKLVAAGLLVVLGVRPLQKRHSVLPAVAPPLLVGLLGERARPPLERLNRAFTEHRDTIGALVCFGFAGLLTVFALNALC
jgi:hypothetical protein